MRLIIQAAKQAQKAWARTPLHERASILLETARLLRESVEVLAPLLVTEIAKPRKDAETEVARSADLIEYTAHSGNAVILKPPTQGSVSALHLAQCFVKGGVPAGLLSVITGRGSQIGNVMVEHPLVNCISFTGGPTGIDIAKRAGMIPLQMELGGKDVAIVLEDAEVELTAKQIIKGAFSYSGQRCTAVKLVIIVGGAPSGNEVVSRINEMVSGLTVGSPKDNCTIVPLIRKGAADFVQELIQDAIDKGAKSQQSLKRDGNLIWPMVFDDVTADMRLAWEEPFGPVLPIMRMDSVEAAVAHCNASKLALQGSVFSQNIDRAISISDAMETGTVQGFRESGIGSQGIENSLKMMTKLKTTVINLKQASYTMG